MKKDHGVGWLAPPRGPAVLFAANLSILWPELPLAERFERAARAGFGAVELWWPGPADARSLPGLTGPLGPAAGAAELRRG